jgi:hypothetical protein
MVFYATLNNISVIQNKWIKKNSFELENALFIQLEQQ